MGKTSSAGGVLVIFGGVVLLLAALNGSLANVWHAIWKSDSSGGSKSGASGSKPAGTSGRQAQTFSYTDAQGNEVLVPPSSPQDASAVTNTAGNYYTDAQGNTILVPPSQPPQQVY